MSKIKSPWDNFSFTPTQSQTQQPSTYQPPAVQQQNRGNFSPRGTTQYTGNRTRTQSNTPWQQQQPVNSRWGTRNTTQQAGTPWQQSNQQQMHPALYHQPGDQLPSYYQPPMFVDENGFETPTPTAEQWLQRHGARSIQVGVGYALMHFAEGLVSAYLPWKIK